MIYTLCPAHVKSGGPELLHQLVHKLNLMGFDACLVYYGTEEGRHPVHEDFEKYNAPFVQSVTDEPGSLVIVPEVYIDLLPQIHHAGKAIWWLSVDFAVFTDTTKAALLQDPSLLHFVQSEYARQYVMKQWNGSPSSVFFLSDYLNGVFLSVATELSMDQNRSPLVVFNARKGMEHTLSLIAESDARVTWKALKGLSAQGMREALLDARIYIDFGAHPGKDRIPREAAACGCCVITNREGAADNAMDVEIPSQYKLEATMSPKEQYQFIVQVLENYENCARDFDSYRQKISSEYLVFEQEVNRLFHMLESRSFMETYSEEDLLAFMLEGVQSGDWTQAYSGLLAFYRQGCPQSYLSCLLEAYIRYGIGEYHEALYSVWNGLQYAPEDHELCLLGAQAALEVREYQRSLSYCSKAMEFSKGTADEAQILEACKSVLAAIRGIS